MVGNPTPIQMFDELIQRGAVTPAAVDPGWWTMPTAYVSVPTFTAFVTPPISETSAGAGSDAKLGSRPKRNPKRKRRSKR